MESLGLKSYKIQYIVEHHSYDCPAVSAFPIEFTHKDFQKWIITQTRD